MSGDEDEDGFVLRSETRRVLPAAVGLKAIVRVFRGTYDLPIGKWSERG